MASDWSMQRERAVERLWRQRLGWKRPVEIREVGSSAVCVVEKVSGRIVSIGDGCW